MANTNTPDEKGRYLYVVKMEKLSVMERKAEDRRLTIGIT